MKLYIALAIIIFTFVSLALVEIYTNYGKVRAFCPNGYCSPIPQGLSGIAVKSKFVKHSPEWWNEYCNQLLPLSCNALD